jgi:serine phosphatase RsbU (regulator of sigma subunit)
MKSIIKLLLLLLPSFYTFGQINQNGLPFIRNYTPEEYDASDQIWAAVQDHRGLMYFGSTDKGVLEYDGKSWRKIPVSNNSIVRSLAVDSLGTIFVGAVGEFGYLTPTPGGKLIYKSLIPLVGDSTLTILDVYKINFHKGDVYFYTQGHLFRYNGKEIRSFNINPTKNYYNLFSFSINDHLYIGSYTLGLRELIDTTFTIAPNGDFFIKNNVYSMTAYNAEWANMITYKGIFRYNQKTGEVVSISSWNDFYKNFPDEGAIPYNSIAMNNSSLGLSFLFGKKYSFAQTDSLGNAVTVLNINNGLQDETVTDIFQPKKAEAPLWLCLNIGITKADLHSQIRRFWEESGLRGGILSITRFNETLFVGTMSGVFYKTSDKDGFSNFRKLNEINTSAWSFLHFKEPETGKTRLLVGTTSGIYEVDKNYRVVNISEQDGFKGEIEHIGNALHQSVFQPNIVYIGWTSLAAMKWENGKWKNLGRIKREFLTNDYKSIGSTKNNELWLATRINGVTRVTFTDKDTIIDNFDTEQGLPGMKDNLIVTFNDKVFFATENGLYYFNDVTKTFEIADLPDLDIKVNGYGINRAVRYGKGYAFTCFSGDGMRWVETHVPESDGSISVNRKSFKSIPPRWADALHADPDGTVWVAISTELFSYNSSISRNYDEPFSALIRKVTTKSDSILFEGSFIKELPSGSIVVSSVQNPKQTPTLPFRYNRLTFEVASNSFEKEESIEYSFILEGQEKDWSKWTTDPRPIYNYISEGSYTFKVKARNIYGVESSIATYSFSITPPWYRSIVAIISYVILLGLFIWGIVVLNTRRLIAEKERLEQIVKERTAEVVAQKEEIEHQRDKIFEQNEEIKSSINYASRIQSALLTPVETINEMFADYFILFLPRDIVSGDFYWHTQVGNRKICAISDCTGHGVPGGFMSMLGIGFLTQIVAKDSKLTASQILDQLRAMIIAALHQTGKVGENKDGMDIALYIIDTETGMLEFSGANNPLILIRDNEVIQVKGDKMPIGIHLRCETPFTNNVMEYKKGDVIYTFSDGYADQFGGPEVRKFMIKNLKDLMLEIHQKPMPEQREIFHKTLVNWHGDTPRIDDVVLMGQRL